MFLMADSIIILWKGRIKDASPRSRLKGSDLTPAIAAELWRPPMKVFAFDLIQTASRTFSLRFSLR